MLLRLVGLGDDAGERVQHGARARALGARDAAPPHRQLRVQVRHQVAGWGRFVALQQS